MRKEDVKKDHDRKLSEKTKYIDTNFAMEAFYLFKKKNEKLLKELSKY